MASAVRGLKRRAEGRDSVVLGATVVGDLTVPPPPEPRVTVLDLGASVVCVLGIVVVAVDRTVVVGGTVTVVVVVGAAVVVVGATVVEVVVGGSVSVVVVDVGLLAGRVAAGNAVRATSVSSERVNAASHTVVGRGTVEVGVAGLGFGLVGLVGLVGRVDACVTIVTRAVDRFGPSCAATKPTVAMAMTSAPRPATMTLRRRLCRRRLPPIVVASS